ncbi:GD24395 [Drosophila simulans]|uniref:GD24395 n=1 Tax=Drosophila simulans TaxID=7240 RepID=B4R2C8_DROSI|nr:GD24395 [Drosophila simulans]
MSRSPMRVAEITVQGVAATSAIPNNGSATEVARLASAASITTSQIIIDLIRVPTQKIASKSPPGSPIRPFDLSAYQNVGLRGLLDMMSARINIALSAFETQRHVTKVKEPKPVSYATIAKDASAREGWAKVMPKRSRKKPEAIILKKTGEASYADMLRQKDKKDPTELLLEIEGKAYASVPAYRGVIEGALKVVAAVRMGAQRMALTCSGMDEATTAEELHRSLTCQFQGILAKPEDAGWNAVSPNDVAR